jgi:hypothetical protein
MSCNRGIWFANTIDRKVRKGFNEIKFQIGDVMNKNPLFPILCIIFIAFIYLNAPADIPRVMNFQGYLVDEGGNPPPNNDYDMLFKIWTDSTGGDSLWAQEITNVEIDSGLYSVTLGIGHPININPNQQLWLEVDIEGLLNTDDRYRLAAVPYSLSAIMADSCRTAGGRWNVVDSVLYTNDFWGIARGGAGNVINNNTGPQTILNLGTACTLGVHAHHSTISGGFENSISSGHFTTIAGGRGNHVEQNYATVSGGYINQATAAFATVGGGDNNTASREYAVVSGGWNNVASGEKAVIGGGDNNNASRENATVGGGDGNTASWQNATVGGGESNTASGQSATVPGGEDNIASGRYSFAAGRHAQATHEGSFVWADANGSNFESEMDNRFHIRASGGTVIYTDRNATIGAILEPNASQWNTVSDSTKKRNIRPVNGEEILYKLSRLSIMQWSYKAADPNIEHIGPMAQDFYAVFGLGSSDTTISSGDPAGIALAACQELHKITKKQAKEIDGLKAKVGELEKFIEIMLSQNQSKIKSAKEAATATPAIGIDRDDACLAIKSQ